MWTADEGVRALGALYGGYTDDKDDDDDDDVVVTDR